MRHIPEDELHAYLDQGLSRSQCVEIESHLAVCHMCRIARDGIAALRDRTTALLTRLAPPRSIPPPGAPPPSSAGWPPTPSRNIW
jgi:anti-sigma factor RsiW